MWIQKMYFNNDTIQTVSKDPNIWWACSLGNTQEDRASYLPTDICWIHQINAETRAMVSLLSPPLHHPARQGHPDRLDLYV